MKKYQLPVRGYSRMLDHPYHPAPLHNCPGLGTYHQYYLIQNNILRFDSKADCFQV